MRDQMMVGTTLVARNLKPVRLAAVAVGKVAVVSSWRLGLRSWAAAKAAAATMRGADVVALREHQILVWNAAMEAAAFECEQAARALTLSNPTDDPRAQTNVVADPTSCSDSPAQYKEQSRPKVFRRAT